MSDGRAPGRVANVFLAVDAARERNPWLNEPVTPRAVWRAIQHDGITVRRGRIRQRARSSAFDGDGVITLRSDLSARLAWKYALHEYGHLCQHFPDAGEHVINLVPCRCGDPREDEANLFAVILIVGPAATPHHPAIAPLADAITARGMGRKAPAQIPLALPEPPQPRAASATRPAPIGKVRRTARLFSNARTAESEDFQRVRYNTARRATEFEDALGRVWLVKDYRAAPAGSGRAYVRERDFMKPGILCRVFESPAGRHCLYRFPDARERRQHLVKHFDRQLAKARALPPRPIREIAAPVRTANHEERR